MTFLFRMYRCLRGVEAILVPDMTFSRRNVISIRHTPSAVFDAFVLLVLAFREKINFIRFS